MSLVDKLQFRALDMAEELGWNDDIGLTNAEIDAMIASAIAPAQAQYRQGVEQFGGAISGTFLNNSGIANKAFAGMTADLLGVGQKAALSAQAESDKVLLNERQMYNNLLAQKDSMVANAEATQAQIDASKKSWLDRAMQGLSIASGFISPVKIPGGF